MNGRRQSLTAPSGVGGGGGGGSRRILAATLTFTGASSTVVNRIIPTITGTLPNPSTILPGGTLQSVECEFRTLMDYNISLNYEPTPLNVAIPVFFTFTVGTACGFRTLTFLQANANGDNTTLNVSNRLITDDCSFNASSVASWPVSASMEFRFGMPIYGDENNYPNAYLGAGVTFNSLQADGEIAVYYLFE